MSKEDDNSDEPTNHGSNNSHADNIITETARNVAGAVMSIDRPEVYGDDEVFFGRISRLQVRGEMRWSLGNTAFPPTWHEHVLEQMEPEIDHRKLPDHACEVGWLVLRGDRTIEGHIIEAQYLKPSIRQQTADQDRLFPAETTGYNRLPDTPVYTIPEDHLSLSFPITIAAVVPANLNPDIPEPTPVICAKNKLPIPDRDVNTRWLVAPESIHSELKALPVGSKAQITFDSDTGRPRPTQLRPLARD